MSNWSLDIEPEAYLSRFPEGPNAELAKKVLAERRDGGALQALADEIGVPADEPEMVMHYALNQLRWFKQRYREAGRV